MALRAVSIVGMESTIRSQFDQRIERVQRSVREHRRHRATSSRRRSVPQGGSQTRSEESPSDGDNGADARDEQPSNNNSNNSTITESPPAPTQPEDMHESGDLGRSPTLDVSQAGNGSDELGPPTTTTATAPRNDSVDIRVEYEAFPEVPEPSETGDSAEEAIEREIQGLSRNNDNDRNMTCCKFYRAHWVGHLVTGLMSGCLFVLLGIIFLVNENQTIPIYAGIILIILGLAPCCMALNRYRYARLYERERRRALRRLGALRRAHRRRAREERRRRRQAYSDLPPAYDNLGFDLGEDDPDLDNISVGTSSSQGSFVLPTYDQCVKKEGQLPPKENPGFGNESQTEDTHDGNTNNNNGERPPDLELTELPQTNNEVVVVVEPVGVDADIEMVDTHFEADTIETPPYAESHSGSIDVQQGTLPGGGQGEASYA